MRSWTEGLSGKAQHQHDLSMQDAEKGDKCTEKEGLQKGGNQATEFGCIHFWIADGSGYPAYADGHCCKQV